MRQLEDLDPFPFGQHGPKGKDPASCKKSQPPITTIFGRMG